MKTHGHQNGWSTRSEHLALCTFCRPNAEAPFQKGKHILHPRLHDTSKGDYSHHYSWNMHFLLLQAEIKGQIRLVKINLTLS